MKKLYLAVLAGAASMSAAAADIGLSVEAGTTGLGIHAVVPVQKQLNARIGTSLLNYSFDGSTSNVDYDFKLKLKTLDALLDWYPAGGAFRFTGGVVYNGNKITANGRPTAAGTYTLNGNTYTAASAGTLNGQVDFRNFAPYLGIGWGNAVAGDKAGFGFNADLGVLLQGSPRTSLANNGCTAPAPVCAQLAADVAAENVRLRDEVKDFKAYPVLRVGVSYRF
ncbi:hypothetical protein [Noviherbaspirillum sp.]|uniref:hypothetical protein n=1 Tax=Noviherbaspirillum sp. TaxID=1926288 RepID=UPI002D672F07|nr:hypothetical protein [Noviherbaspirillum sp.]HZW23352.1 hypothetical protein [Noviherbaspirillum sp.]